MIWVSEEEESSKMTLKFLVWEKRKTQEVYEESTGKKMITLN